MFDDIISLYMKKSFQAKDTDDINFKRLSNKIVHMS